ncbi:isopenicillin N synthase family dioxygenase [Ilumatobacter coccineus]|uniref:Putative oxidoreductase n=1 Tax=Ilumatobacter coccineus (strain NBRC 103263 / KCTC 29153 / YM16-304) TaxID=1313172 RepID=A0A6C7ECP0_ILUCY|nr:2OG-Fe(II) oxygenase family protein [Ilumatobacter coccineus]BAN03762.1 putative oxidoreductase [Ilumatobacter coccineus YM16-304]
MAIDELVPTIDISDPSDDEFAALDRACRDHGFFLLTGHGLDALIEETWVQAREFFTADRSLRVAVERDDQNPLGWFDRELTKRKRDSKQVFDFTDPNTPAVDAYNRWPDGFDRFRPTLAAFYDAFSDLAERTVALVHRALDLPDDVIRDHVGDRTTSSVRLNHYPVGDPVPENERDGLRELGDMALGYHTDPGVLTLLLQDATGGLQAQAANGDWVDVEPRPGTIVVNLADAMQVWTNDQYRAAVHRVVPMTSTDRMSIPYFFNPPRSAVIEPIGRLAGDAPRYRSFVWRDYMRARTEDNYEDLGADDTQIADYAIGATATG